MMPAIISRPVIDDSYHSSGFSSISSGGVGSELLRKVREFCFLDSPYGYVDAAAPAWWSGDADSSSAVPGLESDVPEEESHRLMSSAEQIALAVHTLGFSKRQLAELFGVSRQAIYDWIKGGNVSEENAAKLSELARLLMEVTIDTRRPLYHRFTTRPLAEGEPSILDLLRAETWNTGRILDQLRLARNLTTQRQARQDKGRYRNSRAEHDENLMDNLLSLGEE